MSNDQVRERQSREDCLERQEKYERSMATIGDLMPPELSVLWYIRFNDTQEAYDFVYSAYKAGIDPQVLYKRYELFRSMRDERDKAFRETFNKTTKDHVDERSE